MIRDPEGFPANMGWSQYVTMKEAILDEYLDAVRKVRGLPMIMEGFEDLEIPPNVDRGFVAMPILSSPRDTRRGRRR